MAEKKKEEGEEETAEPKKSKKKLIIIIVVVLVLVIGGGAGAFLALSGSKTEESAEGGEHGEEAALKELDSKEAAVELPGAVFPLDTFIVNLRVKGSFLKTTIQLEFAQPELPPSLDSDVARIRDSVIRLLSSKSAAEILTPEGKDLLAQELTDLINESLGSEDVVNVYFTEFIIQ